MEVLDCGHSQPEAPAHDELGQTCCYDCALARERQDMMAPDRKRYIAYVSTDGKHITNWPGGHLARVLEMRERRMPEGTFSVWAIAPNGSRWFGVGSGKGMVISLRKVRNV